VRRAPRLQGRLLAAGFCALLIGALVAAGGADSATSSRGDALRASLEQARSELSSIQANRARITQDRTAVRIRLGVARRNLVGAQQRLAAIVHAAYEDDQTDPLAAVLASQSLDDAVTTIDDLARAGEQARAIVTQTRSARARLAALTHQLAEADARSAALETTAREHAAALVYEVAASDRAAEAAAAAAAAVPSAQASPISAPAPVSVSSSAGGTTIAPVVATAGRIITVVATAYSTNGTTASGLPTGWGVVAVDPSVIPLGTRLTIPGYGDAVAADTGGAVQGATVDLWFPTEAAALAWGRRVIAVTLH
jgi:3D (Asp-Asp-Asp) domain-containing protein